MGQTEESLPQQTKARPKGRSLSDFGTLKPAEQTLLECCRVGEVAEIEATRPTKQNEQNTVRAGFLRFLLLGGDDQTPIHEHGIQLRGAYIEGTLRLKAALVCYDFSLSLCTFVQALELTDANFEHSVKLISCELPGLQGQRLIAGGMMSMRDVKALGTVNLLDAQIGGQLNCSGANFDGLKDDALLVDGAVIKGDVFLHLGFKAVGPVRLLGAQIGGQFNCRGASFDGKNGDALSFDGAVIKGDVFLHHGFKAVGHVRLMGVQIGGQLNCSGANFDGLMGDALSVDGAVIKGDACLYNGFKAVGPVRLLGAQIGGQLNCSGANFDGLEGYSLSFDGAVIGSDVFLHNGFKAERLVRFIDAQIGGQLNCSGASFDGKNGDALSFDGVVIKGSVFLDNGFKAEGAVRLLRAQITGQFNCIGSSFDGKNGVALVFDGAVIKGDVFLRTGFKAVGEVRLLSAQISGSLDCSDASFDGINGDALSIDRVVIKGNVFLNSGFKAEGPVRLVGAQINGQLDCNGASFDGKLKSALFAKQMRVDGTLVLRNLLHPLHKSSLTGAKVAVLSDDEKAWGSDIELNGFVYDFLDASAPVRATSRLVWLDKQTPEAAGIDGCLGADSRFRPQPWRQLQHVLREMGHTEEALEVGLAFEHRLRQAGLIGQPPASWPSPMQWLYSKLARALHYFYGALTGFGYRPMLLLGWFLANWFVCAGIYWWAAAQEGVFAPSNPIVFQHPDYLKCRPDRESVWRKNLVHSAPKDFTGPGNWYLCEDLREEYTGLSPLAFSLDVLMPLVDLQQEKDWAPMIPTPKAGITDELSAFGWKYFTRLVIWIQTLFGWLYSLLLVAIVSGLTRRKE